MWQTKYALAVPKNLGLGLGLGLNFWPCSEGFFLSLGIRSPWIKQYFCKKGQPCVYQGPILYLYTIYNMHKCIIREAFLSTLAKVGMTKYIAISKCAFTICYVK